MTDKGGAFIIIGMKKEYTETDKFVFKGLKIYLGLLIAPFLLLILFLFFCLI